MSGRTEAACRLPRPPCPAGQVCPSGFTYMGVLIMVAVTGISLAGASQYWSTIAQREREAELLYRGDQIRRAIASFYAAGLGDGQPTYPRSVEDLLKDPRYPGIRRHLRKPYADPMHPGGEWQWVRDTSGSLKGVFSKSTLAPLKKGDFELEYREFQKAKTYADWRFVFNPG